MDTDASISDELLVALDIKTLIKEALESPQNCCLQETLCRIVETIASHDYAASLNRLQLWLWPGETLLMKPRRYGTLLRCRNGLTPVFDMLVAEGDTRYHKPPTKEMNRLRKRGVVQFPYYYLHVEAGKPIETDRGDVVAWLLPKRQFSAVSYLVSENLGMARPISEHLKRTTSFLQLLSPYLQALMGLEEAFEQSGLTQGHICERVMIGRNAASLENKQLGYSTYAEETVSIKCFDYCPVFIDPWHCQADQQGQRPIYDIYYLSAVFIKSVRTMQASKPGVREFVQFVNDFLLGLGVPHWYVTNIEDSYCPFCHKDGAQRQRIRFPDVVEEIGYDKVCQLLPQLIIKYKGQDVWKVRKTSKTSTKEPCECSSWEEKLLRYKPVEYPHDEYLTACYSGLSEVSDSNNAAQLSYIRDLQTRIERGYLEIEEDRSMIQVIEPTAGSIAKSELDEQCALRLEFFIGLLRQKVLLDELDSILYCAPKTGTDLAGDMVTLENYIREHHARVLRILSEAKTMYDACKYIVPWEMENTIERIHILLTSKTVRTR